MKNSPLQLLRYVVPECSCRANPKFNPEKDCEGGIENLSVNSVVTQQETPEGFQGHSWSVELTINQKLPEGKNFPYGFSVAILGFFNCKDGFPSPAEEEQFVRVNGSSMLYSAAREMVRSFTNRGPWIELFLPTISFYDNAPKNEDSQTVSKSS